MFVIVGITAVFYWVGSSSTILLLNMSNETSLLPPARVQDKKVTAVPDRVFLGLTVSRLLDTVKPMDTPTDPDALRQSALRELASLTTIEFGTLSEIYRNRPSPDGSGSVRRGPYFKHQCWENGKNRSTYIRPEHVESLRQDLENGQRFQQITDQLASAAIQQGRILRACLPKLDSAPTPEKKTSKLNATPKNTAKRKSFSPKHAKSSSKRKGPRT
jgi:hypothetical protein